MTDKMTYSVAAIHGDKKPIEKVGVGIGYIAYNENNGSDLIKKKNDIDIFNPNASTSGYNQVSAWTMT